MTYDLLIKGGTVVDPDQELNGVYDIAIENGKIADVQAEISQDSHDVIDANGLIVTPGLIDMHVHAYWGVCCYGLEPDAINLGRGVTTALDCGSSGAETFEHFRRTVIDRVQTRLYALLNISAMGIISANIGELLDMRWALVDEAATMGTKNRDRVLGIKVRLSSHVIHQDDKLDALKRAIAAAEGFGGFVMVHVGDIETPLETLTQYLRPGDVITHAFRHWGGVRSAEGEITDVIQSERERGIVFDVGHGGGSCSFETIETAMAAGFKPDTISSDVSTISVTGPVYDLVTTMSKFLHFGMSLNEVVRCATTTPAKQMGINDDLGSLRIGTTGDITILRLDEGDFTYIDAERQQTSAAQKLNTVATVREGKIYHDWNR